MRTHHGVPRQPHCRHAQCGAALLLLLLLVTLAFGTIALSALTTGDIARKQQATTSAAISQAKEALLAYAATHDRPGVLPCPDTNNDGSADANGNAGCFSRIGRLPWKQLKLPDLRDGDGERLWYAVATDFANVPSTQIVNNEESPGALSVCGPHGCGNGGTLGGIAAIVFSPGAILADNDRKSGNDPNPNPALNTDPDKKPENYLDRITLDAVEHNNATGGADGAHFIAAERSANFNDRLLAIPASEVFANVNRRMETKATLADIANCLADYGINNTAANDRRLPWAAPLAIDVNAAAQYDDSPGLRAGRFPFHVSDSTHTTPTHPWSSTLYSTQNRNNFGACATVPTAFPDWWNSWKPYVYYAVGANFAPDNASAPSPNSCTAPSGCIAINGSLAKFAAIVIYSGRKLSMQSRTNIAEKMTPGNYLEDANLVAITASGTLFSDAAASPSFNDVVVCINPDMSISRDCT